MKMQKMQMILAVLMATQAQAQYPTDSHETVVVQSAPRPKPVARYDEATNAVVEESPGSRNPIVILNKNSGYQDTRQAVVQEQPVTIVEANPLSDSRAEAMRKRRQGLEVNTEQKIVEKLEEARMEDEKARAERLFGSGFDSGRTEQTTPVYTQPAPAPVVVAAPPVVQGISEEDKASLRSEIREAITDAKKETNESESQDTYFIGALVGMSEYPDAVNVKGNVATGLSLGMTTADRVVVEGTFLYSDYEVDDYTSPFPYKDMSQYNFTAALKYQFLSGKLRPYAGGVVGYTYRKATNRYNAGSGGYYGGGGYGGGYGPGVNPNDLDGTSNAFDMGATAGLDLQITDSFAIGGDVRYMTNVSYRRESSVPNFWGQPAGHSAVEELDYYTVMLGGKFTF